MAENKNQAKNILVKGKSIDFGIWLEGFYLIIDENAYILCDAELDSDGENTDLYATDWYKIIPETVCNCSDVIAKEGKIIWEKDIVDYDGTIGVVKFGKYGNNFHYGFYIDWIDCAHLRNELLFWEGKVKVIGNIIDNPDLIK